MADWLRTIYDALGTGVGWVFSKTWLPPKDFDLWTWLVVPGGGYGCVLIAFGLAELVFPQQKRPWNRATLLSSTYILFTGKLGLYVLLVTPSSARPGCTGISRRCTWTRRCPCGRTSR
ncbi:MAG: hypothetical protein IPK67_18120 [Planctomycetes bacterium]|nr:hypothetical protein [Planctomycetota bacterium]